jgi:hypothetical protein
MAVYGAQKAFKGNFKSNQLPKRSSFQVKLTKRDSPGF